MALTAYSYYGYAQMAVGAIKAIEGGGTAMANFAGGVAKGYAKGLAFSGLMLGLTHLQNSVNKSTSSPDNAKAVETKPGSGSSDGHSNALSDASSNSENAQDIQARQVLLKKKIDGLYETGQLKESNLFQTHEDAASSVLSAVTPLAHEHQLEVGGNIEEVIIREKTYYKYTRPEVGLESTVPVSGHAIGYHTHPSGDVHFSNLGNESRGYASDTKWVRTTKQHLYVGAMQGSSVKISICEYQSSCMRDAGINGALGRKVK